MCEMMTALVHEHLVPLTFRIGFLNSGFSEVVAAFVEWKHQHFRSIDSREMMLPLEHALRQLQPLTSAPRRWLIVGTRSDWVAYFDNGIQGPDPVSAICHLTGKLRCRGVIATLVPHTLDEETGQAVGRYGAIQFELFAARPTEFLNYERTVGVVYEAGKWVFDARGKEQAFEDTSTYQKRRVVERFSSEMLVAYCRALGVDVNDPDFYKHRAILVSAADPAKGEQVTLSIQDAQKRMGLRKGSKS